MAGAKNSTAPKRAAAQPPATAPAAPKGVDGVVLIALAPLKYRGECVAQGAFFTAGEDDVPALVEAALAGLAGVPAEGAPSGALLAVGDSEGGEAE